MKRIIMMSGFAIVVILISSCKSKNEETTVDDNPFFVEWDTPFGVPPFDKIKNEHYLPAFEEGMKQHKAEIDSIANSKEEPDFDNVIAAMDYSGSMLKKVASVFFNMTSANTSEELQKIAQEISPVLTSHYDDIMMNAQLFQKVDAIYKKKETLSLSTEQMQLLEMTYKGFVRSGALLNAEEQKRMREINSEMSVLTLQFGDNILAETNNFELVIDKKEDLSGLPQPLIDAAAETAKEKEKEGKWVFTLHNPSVLPFLQFADNRDLRKEIQQAYIKRGDNNNEYDNKEIIKKIVALRLEKAQLLGYETHADYVLEMNMAENPAGVFKLLDQLWGPAMKRANEEMKEYQKIIVSEGGDFKLEAWDWRYYAEKYRKLKYNINEEELKPYFELTKVRDGIFYVCKQLYGLNFTQREDIPKYHPDNIVYEVTREDKSHVGILYMDFHPRESKRGGAWMDAFREQYRKGDEFVSPVITIVCNFTKPTASMPSLLTLDEVLTFFHEFGHALHGLLSNGTYPSITSTGVPRDFVELPSQIMEHWALEPEVLKQYAKHYKTGEVISDELIQKIQNAAYFDQGFATVEYLAASYLDMYWHTMKIADVKDVNAFETEALNKLGLMPEIISRYRSTYFSHIFSGGYSAGYYAYIWSGVLDNDAFEAFKEHGIFDKATADAFRINVLEAGHRDKASNLYRAFRGKDPEITPLLKARGLI
jgi:peptidyl-dipeptidase Dcp